MYLSQLLTFGVLVIITSASGPNGKVFEKVRVLWDPEDKATYTQFTTDETTNNLGEVVPNNVTQWGRFSISVRSWLMQGVGDVRRLKKNSVTGIAKVTKISLGNAIEEIEPEAFKDLPDLENLKLNHNRLKKIEMYTFADLPISHLDLNSNEISVLERGAFYRLSKLTTLNLYNNKLQEFSTDVFYQEELSMDDFDTPLNLTHLDLDLNSLSNIVSVANLPKLKHLSVANNQLSSLPDFLFKEMPELEVLSAGNNKISSLPQDLFKGTPNLRSVSLNGNFLTSIPEGLFHNTKIQNLDLSFNIISSVPPTVFDISTLESLNLGCNKLKVWSSTFLKNTPHLRSLIVSENLVKALPDDSFSSGLVDINFSNNKIVDVSDGAFKRIEKMNSLDIAGNPLSVESLRLLLGNVKATYKNVQSTRSPCSDLAAQYPTTVRKC